MYSIMEDMAKIFPTLTEQEQQYLNELASGSRQSKVLQAITSNWNDVELAVGNALNSQNSALVENAKYMDSVDGKVQKLNSSFQQMANTLIDSGLIKGGLDFANFLTKVASVASGVPAQIGAITIALSTLSVASKSNVGQNFLGFFKDIGKQAA